MSRNVARYEKRITSYYLYRCNQGYRLRLMRILINNLKGGQT